MESQVHSSLVSAENALVNQSERHPDGWGVAYYVAGAPHLLRSVQTAVNDRMFQHVSGIVTSQTVLAHLRKATQGQLSVIDTHPFQYGAWAFAHNGNIREFPALRAKLITHVPPILRRFILGQTDSEVLFYLLLGKMAQRCELERPGYPLDALADAVRETVTLVCEIAGELCTDTNGSPEENYLTFVITNGKAMLGHQGGKELYVSTHKSRCPDRETCPYFAPECERQVDDGFVSHMIFSSEPLQGDNVWRAMAPREMYAADWRMQLFHESSA